MSAPRYEPQDSDEQQNLNDLRPKGPLSDARVEEICDRATEWLCYANEAPDGILSTAELLALAEEVQRLRATKDKPDGHEDDDGTDCIEDCCNEPLPD